MNKEKSYSCYRAVIVCESGPGPCCFMYFQLHGHHICFYIKPFGERKMCGSRKYPYSPHRRSTEIPRGKSMKYKLEFPGGEGVQNKKPSGGGVYGYFLELHNKGSSK